MKKEIKILPNPEIIRQSINSHCAGCNRVFENYAPPEGTVLTDVCMAYEMPDTKWRNYFLEKGTKMIKGKEVEILYHNNPCPLASHMEHNPKPVEQIQGKRKLNPIKASKRR
jgi:hypothetical protein